MSDEIMFKVEAVITVKDFHDPVDDANFTNGLNFDGNEVAEKLNNILNGNMEMIKKDLPDDHFLQSFNVVAQNVTEICKGKA